MHSSEGVNGAGVVGTVVWVSNSLGVTFHTYYTTLLCTLERCSFGTLSCFLVVVHGLNSFSAVYPTTLPDARHGCRGQGKAVGLVPKPREDI